MAKKYEISEEQSREIQQARKDNRNKNVDRRLHALLLYAEGRTGKEISEITGYNQTYLYNLYRKYHTKGLEAIVENRYVPNCNTVCILVLIKATPHRKNEAA